MGLVQINNIEDFVNINPKRLAELNQHMQDEQNKVIRGGITGEGQDLSMEDESRINDNIGDVENDHQNHHINNQGHHNHVIKKSSKLKIQGPLVCWGMFLPVRSLKVLLVENDDSTRHVLYALLRNCGYEVEAVEDGEQAWRILEDLSANIDLVLTEVALPSLTGIGLLSKIMSHKTRKNIPVIMMSSHDSMDIVFKCLSRGAIDFLVKPLRNNELKNLWQHVWRRCHSSSGSGSQSGVRTQKSLRSESGEHSDNKHGNCDEDDIGSIGLNARDKSDNGSGTQSSWTKMAVEVNSPRPMSLREQLGDQRVGSNCERVIYLTPKTTPNNKVAATKDCETQDALNMMIGIDLEIAASRSIPTLEPCGRREEVPSKFVACNINKSFEKEKVDEKEEKGQEDQNSNERLAGKSKNQATGPTSAFTNINSNSDPLLETQCLENPNGMVSHLENKSIYGNKELPKSLNGTPDVGSSVQDQNVLKQSHRSAFSRYNLSSLHQGPTGNVGSCSPLDSSSEAAKTESVQGMRTHFNSMPPDILQSSGSNNNYELGSSTDDNDFTEPSVAIDKLKRQNATIKYIQPVEHLSLQHLAQENGDEQHIQVQYYHHRHHMYNVVAYQLVNQNDNAAGNLSLNGSASGSHHGSNVDPGNNNNSNATLPAGKAAAGNMELHHRISEKEGTTSLMRLEAPTLTIQNRFARREAALNKFRQKRKERCFEKRVRYQSRKKLADQRPRVRGQFVRQATDENKEK